MHFSGSTSTMPLVYCTIAPGAGQAARQPGSAQCMHWSLRSSQANPCVPVSISRNWIRFQKFGASDGIVWYEPAWVVLAIGRSFHSWHATSHALQPMQVEVSMYLATV